MTVASPDVAGSCANLPTTATVSDNNTAFQSSYQANGCIPAVASTDPAVACAPTAATDQTSINNAINACLQATAVQPAIPPHRTRNCRKCHVVAGPLFSQVDVVMPNRRCWARGRTGVCCCGQQTTSGLPRFRCALSWAAAIR